MKTTSKRVLVVARTSYEAQTQRQLSFVRGDVVQVVNTSAKWHTGILIKSSKYPITKKVMYFPPSFFKPKRPDPEKVEKSLANVAWNM